MNPIDALAKGNMLQVIFFAVIFGFEKRAYFEAAEGSEQAPKVEF